MNSTKIAAPSTSYTVEQSPSNRRHWFVFDPASKVVGDPFSSKKVAQAQADFLTSDAEFEASYQMPTAAADLKTVAAHDVTVIETNAQPTAVAYNLDGMPYSEIMELARPERDAVREWMAAGSKGHRPATPILDWTLNLDLVCKPAKAERTPRTPGVAQSRTADQQTRFVAILTEARDDGGKWHQAARKLTAEGIPTSRGGGWYYSTVQGYAKSMGLI